MKVTANKTIPGGAEIKTWKPLRFNFPPALYFPESGAVSRADPLYQMAMTKLFDDYNKLGHYRNLNVDWIEHTYTVEMSNSHYEAEVNSLDEFLDLLRAIDNMYPDDVIEISPHELDEVVLWIDMPD